MTGSLLSHHHLGRCTTRLREGEPLAETIRRLNKIAQIAYSRQWHKTRPGAHEKRSERRRHREANRKRNQWTGSFSAVYIGLCELHSRKELFHSKRKPFKRRERWWEEA